MHEFCTFCNRITPLWAKGNQKLVAPEPTSLQAVELLRHIVAEKDEDGGMFGEKIKGREVKVLKPPNVPK